MRVLANLLGNIALVFAIKMIFSICPGITNSTKKVTPIQKKARFVVCRMCKDSIALIVTEFKWYLWQSVFDLFEFVLPYSAFVWGDQKSLYIRPSEFRAPLLKAELVLFNLHTVVLPHFHLFKTS